ncbi:BMP family lipoprotein [Sphaerisporangium dianthi]|uniref:BMP family protein n=1 Tax=Sphaerisporangium dianthi TaxID=1436120 RepID=A0ABV9CBL7_9ACTN
MQPRRARHAFPLCTAICLTLAVPLYGAPPATAGTARAAGTARHATDASGAAGTEAVTAGGVTAGGVTAEPVTTGTANATARGRRVGIAYQAGGATRSGMNDSVRTGLWRAGGLLPGYSVEEPSKNATDAQRAKLLRRLAKGGHNPVIAVGHSYARPLAKVAAEFPRTKFAIVDDATVKAPNVSNLLFAENEAGFLAGVAAALKSRARHVGFVGAVKEPVTQRYQAGFQAGAKAVEPGIKVDSAFITTAPGFGGFDLPKKGKAKARALFEKGADVVFHAAGGSAPGVFAAAKAAGGLVIGCDVDELVSAGDAGHEVIVTSALKRFDVAVYDFIERSITGATKPGVTVYDAKAGGIDYADTGGKVLDIEARLQVWKRAIATGMVRVPTRPS